MYQIYTASALLLLFLKGGVAVSRIVKEGDDVEIQCDPKQERLTLWFRMKENEPIKFIASFSGATLKSGSLGKLTSRDGKHLLINTFDKKTDAGAYGCASINNNQLFFGEATYLFGEPEPKPIKNTPAPTTRAPAKSITAKTVTVTCKSKETKLDVKVGCELQIFIPLVAGCGVLFLLLLITILYCNHIRTRRCPHHYKRQPRSAPAGHKPLPNPQSF